jgi:hypothetical protein
VTIESVASAAGQADMAFKTQPSSGVYTERMRITDDGNVGIGTTNPQFSLDIAGFQAIRGSSSQLRLKETDAPDPEDGWHFSVNSGVLGFIHEDNSGPTYTGGMYITPAGNVGIGTTTPSTALTVNGRITGGFGATTTAATLDWNDSTNTMPGSGHGLLLGTATNGPSAAGANYYHPFSFEYASKDGTGNLTQMAIPYGLTGAINSGMYMRGRYSGTWTNWVKMLSENTSGNVGIGTIAPSQKLHVVGNLRVQGSTDCTLGAGAGATNCTSDERLKDEVTPIENSLEKINSVKGVDFVWNEDSLSPGKRSIGVIAQDIQKVFPTAVIENDDGYLSVDYAVLVSPLIEATKELDRNQKMLSLMQEGIDNKQDRKIASLEKENQEIKEENKEIKNELQEMRAAICSINPQANFCHRK